MTGLRKILDSIINPGASIGRGLALHGIDESMAQAYVIAMMDKDQLEEMLENIDPEVAEKIRDIMVVVDDVFTAMGVASLGQAVANFGPQTVFLELKDALQASGKVHDSHKAIIEIMAEANIPGFEKIPFEVNGKPVTIYIDSSGHTNNHGQALSPDTDYYAEFDRNSMSRAEIKEINKYIQQQISKTEAEASNSSSYDVSMKLLKMMDPELHSQIKGNHDKGLGTCLPDASGVTKETPEVCAQLTMNSGGLY